MAMISQKFRKIGQKCYDEKNRKKVEVIDYFDRKVRGI